MFLSHNEFQQNNAIDEFLPEGVGGVTELFKNRILVPFEGDYEKFRHVMVITKNFDTLSIMNSCMLL